MEAKKRLSNNLIQAITIVMTLMVSVSLLQAKSSRGDGGVVEVTLSPEPKTVRITGLPAGTYPVVFESAVSRMETQMTIEDNQVSTLVFNYPAEALISDKAESFFPDSLWVKVDGGLFKRTIEPKDKTKGVTTIENMNIPSFYMGKTEVSNDQFCQFLNACGVSAEDIHFLLDTQDQFCQIFMNENRYVCKKGFEQHPVLEVTWHGAQAFCSWAGGRLPTAAEWEYAASERGKAVLYGNGSNQASISEMNFNEKANGSKRHGFMGKRKKTTMPVASYMPNKLGLHDMSGNVWEWCLDPMSSHYSPTKFKDIYVYCPSCSRVVKGGSWSSHADHCEIGALSSHASCSGYRNVGFRICRSEI